MRQVMDYTFKESVDEGRPKYGKLKLTKDKPKKITQRIWSAPKRIMTKSAYLRMPDINKKRRDGVDYVATSIGPNRTQVYLPVIFESVKEADLGLTYKKGKTVKVKHKTSGKSIVIIDKPNVRKEYEKIGFFAESVNEKVTYHDGGRTVGIDVRDIYDYMVSIKKTNPAKFKKDMKNKALKGIWDRYSKGGKMYKEESVNEKIKLKGKSGMGAISHVGMPKASKGVEKLFKIADTGFGKVGGQTVDSMSANLFKQIYNKANDDIKKKLNTKSEKQLIMILAKMWDKFGKNVKIGSSL